MILNAIQLDTNLVVKERRHDRIRVIIGILQRSTSLNLSSWSSPNFRMVNFGLPQGIAFLKRNLEQTGSAALHYSLHNTLLPRYHFSHFHVWRPIFYACERYPLWHVLLAIECKHYASHGRRGGHEWAYVVFVP